MEGIVPSSAYFLSVLPVSPVIAIALRNGTMILDI